MAPMPLLARVLAVAAAVSVASCKTEATQPPAPAPVAAAPEFVNPGGMWMPAQLAAHGKTLTDLGLAIDPGALVDPTKFPLAAIVSLGGCSASFVSPKGLVITNHHCVIGALQHNSTPADNLLERGFVARTLADEKPAGAEQRIFVTESIRDVTADMTTGLDTITDDAARFEEIQARSKKLEDACEATHTGHACSVRSFFEGAEYYLIDALEIRDVRLVYAPHAGIGVFGGEIDNWRWPRHTGDFSFLRAYVGPDGKPADPSPNNVPYQPPHHLALASEPLEPGDFVMVAGYPGRTNRLSTAAEVRDATAWRYPRDIARYGETMARLEELGKANPDLAIKTTSRMRRLANYHTNFKGMLDGLAREGLAEQKEMQQAELAKWIAADPARTASYGGVFEKLAALDEQYRQVRERDAALREIAEASVVFGAALTAAEAARSGHGKESLAATLDAGMRAYDPALDPPMFALALERASRIAANDRPTDVLTALLGKPQGETWTKAEIDAGVASLFKKTKLGDKRFRGRAVAAKDLAALAKLGDPLLKAATAAIGPIADASAREKARQGAMAALRPKFVAALREFSKTPISPDANSTLRVTYGTVRGYKPTPDAAAFAPFSTVTEMVAKNTGSEPFAAPPSLLAAAAGAGKGPYAVPELGDVPLDFLADLDITGGNSGSPTLNGKGELVGLAFDGNYEAIASNWMFIPGITRSIHVDIRFILWVLDAVDDADHLVVEMGAVPKLGAASAGAPATPAAAPTTAAPTPAAG
jgi:hypothetical protein